MEDQQRLPSGPAVLSSSSDSPASKEPASAPDLNRQLTRKKSVLFAFDSVLNSFKEKGRRKLGFEEQEDVLLFDGSSSSAEINSIVSPKPPRIPAALRTQQSLRLLRVYQLIGITFFAVTGGPFGFEGTVGAGGPVLMQAGLLLFQILWSAPLALMTAELSCMIPLSGGHVLWIYRAFGPFWSFVNSCFAFTCSILDNALYAVLFVEYLSSLLYEDNHRISHAWSILLKLLLIVMVTILNVRGISIIGTAAIILAIAVLSPFAAMIIWGLPQLNFRWIHGQTPETVNWGKFITLLLWNSSGFDGAGNIASEVESPASSYPRALAASVVLILAVYSLPTLIGVSVLPDYKEWKSGTYMLAAKIIGGRHLQIWMGLSEVLSALGLLLTRICINSRIIYGMALVEQVPVFTWLHPRFGTPWVAILITSTLTLLLSQFKFYSLAEADMLFYALSTMLKFGALIQLRFTEPDAFRPFWIPVPCTILAAMTSIPIGLCLCMLYFASNTSQVIGLIGLIAAVFGYLIKELVPQYGKQAEEVVQQRMTRVQQNIERMQQWIDVAIAKEFKLSPPHAANQDTMGTGACNNGCQNELCDEQEMKAMGTYMLEDYHSSSHAESSLNSENTVHRLAKSNSANKSLFAK